MKSSKHLISHLGALGCILLSQNCSLYASDAMDETSGYLSSGCDDGGAGAAPNAVWKFDGESTNPFEPWGTSNSLATGTGVNGSKALRMGTTVGGAGARVESVVKVGKSYHLEGQVKVDNTTGGAVFGAKFINASGGTIADFPANVTSVNGYQKYAVDFQVPANTVTAYVYIWKSSTAGYMYADDVFVTDSSGTTPAPPPTSTTPTPPPTQVPGISDAFKYGVNISAGNGAETILPGTLNGEVYLTPESHFQYYASKGFTSIRVQSLWERLQPVPFGPLDGRLDTFQGQQNDPNAKMVQHIRYYLDMAQKYGMKAWLDVAHNYGRRYIGFNGNWNNKTTAELGSASVPISALADFNKKLAQEFGNHPALIGIEIMNEPHDLKIGTNGWKDACQASIDAIRSVNSNLAILIDGYAWASAMTWPSSNPNIHTLKDPANKLVFSAHQYFDDSAAGIYSGNERTTPNHTNYDIGAQRIQPFIDWLNSHSLQGRGHIGEFGTPNTPQWAEVSRRVILKAKQNGLMLTPHQDIPYPNDPYVMNLFPPSGQGDRYMVRLMQSLKDGSSFLNTPLL